jgi:TolB-like protein
LDAIIRAASDYLNGQLPNGNKLVILNIQSVFPALSEYIIDELIANTVNDRIFPVVDRQQLDTIRAEQNFQYSGEVDDTTAQALGRLAGAQIIVSGAVSRIGDLYRLRVRALNVESAQIMGQFNRNIQSGATVTALVQSQATGYGTSAPVVAAPASPALPQALPSGAAVPQAASTAAVLASVPAQNEATEPGTDYTVGQKGPTNGLVFYDNEPTVVLAALPANVTYRVGDQGPAGGIIFYVRPSTTDGWRYLEAAPADLGKAQWQSAPTNVTGTKDTIGSGKQNTQLIGESSRAALLCQQYSLGGYQDWFLPSKAELDLVYINLKMKDLGGFSDDYYWSSTQSNTEYAWTQQFSDGLQTSDAYQTNYMGNKGKTHSVRAIRQF